MRRILLTGIASLLATMVLLVPGAGASEADQLDRSNNTEVDSVRPPRPTIRCHGGYTFGGHAKVTCKVDAGEHPDAAGYKIIRKGDGERRVVFRTSDTEVTRFRDKDVKVDVRYRYRVVVVDEAGARLQRSRWNSAIVSKQSLERLRMNCTVTDADSTVTDAVNPTPVLCEWRGVKSEKADEYQLWRRVRGQHRELVATLGLDQLSYIDAVPADATKVVYALLAFDEDDKMVARSRLSKISFAPSDG